MSSVRNSCLALAGAALLGSIAAPRVQAQTLGVDFSSPGPIGAPSVWDLGYEFVANSAITATELGTFDYGQNGFSQAQQVGLWEVTGATSGTLLASTFVDNSDPLQGFWRFHAITPVTLTAGTHYIVASKGGEGYTYLVTGLTTDPDITFVQDRFHFNGDSSNTPLAFPEQTDGFSGAQGGGFFGGNVAFGVPLPPPATPEPGTLALLMVSGLGGAGLVLRRRQK